MRIFKDKKGDVTDIITVGFWLLVIAIGIFGVWFMMTNLLPLLSDTVIGDDPNAAAAISATTTYANLALPGTFLIVFFGLLLGVLVSSFFIRTHPIFIPVYILFAIISIIVAVALGNVWGNLKDVDEIATFVGTNTITTIIDVIMSNMVLITLVVFILTIIIIFAKPGGQGQEVRGGATPF